jgi:hypothetical protein
MTGTHDPGRRARYRVPALILVTLLLAGCGGSRAPVDYAPIATSTPEPTATLSPDEVAAATAQAAFVNLAARDDLSFHLAQVATVSSFGSSLADVTYDLDVSGGNFAGTLKANGKTVRLVYVDGITWAKVSGGKWKKSAVMSPEDAADVANPWRYLGPLNKLEFVARGTGDPDRFEFRNAGDIPYQTTAMKEDGMHGTIDGLSVFLASDGTPIGFRLHATAAYTSGALAEKKVDSQTVIDISRFGEDITVKPPK